MAEDNTNGIRINKALAQAGLCSRRQADAFISSGKVRLNGEIVLELGLRVNDGDVLELGGKKVAVRPQKQADFIYLMLNKPVEVVSTVSDPEGRRTVVDLLPDEYAGKRLFPVGRLDYFSEGLLLLTNDGELTLRLTHPGFHLLKYYEVLLREDPDASALEAMRSGMTLAEGEKLAPVQVKRLGRQKRGTLIEMTLNQGVNRQIRRMCRDLGLTILRLRRTGQGSLRLAGLEAGKCRPLELSEVAGLKKAVGLV